MLMVNGQCVYIDEFSKRMNITYVKILGNRWNVLEHLEKPFYNKKMIILDLFHSWSFFCKCCHESFES